MPGGLVHLTPVKTEPAFWGGVGHIPYGHLMEEQSGEEEVRIIFTDSVRDLYLSDAQLD